MFGARHLREDRLFECYLAERSGDAIDPPLAEHLSDCIACTERYADLARFMDELRAEVDVEVGAVFPAERLQLQQQQIARKIDHLGHPARVITFPGHSATHYMPGRASRVAPRWIAAAAAAGLFIGIYVGTFFEPHTRAGSRTAPPQALQTLGTLGTMAVQQPSGAAQPAVLTASPEPEIDTADEFLLELEMAAEGPHTQELIALDELTPHVREIRASLR